MLVVFLVSLVKLFLFRYLLCGFSLDSMLLIVVFIRVLLLIFFMYVWCIILNIWLKLWMFFRFIVLGVLVVELVVVGVVVFVDDLGRFWLWVSGVVSRRVIRL